MRQRILVTALLTSSFLYAFSRQPGITEMHQVSQDLGRSFFSAQNASFALAAIFGIIGGFRVFYDWQMGKPYISREIASWFFASLFMVITGVFLQALYGL